MTIKHLSYRMLSALLLAWLLAGCGKEDGRPIETNAADDKGQPALAQDAAEPASEPASAAANSEIVVLAGDEVIPWLQSENWWGEITEGEQLEAPHLILTGINPDWQENSQKLPVADKKALFYRLMLPLVLHANQMTMERRERLLKAQAELNADGRVSAENLAFLQHVGRVIPEFTAEEAQALTADDAGLGELIDNLLVRIDFVPPGLALGQAAYESGYGTSRFAVEGNSLFGQWTYKGDGMEPTNKRAEKGNYGLKAFEWPFDSVRGYFINLMSHAAYEDFRQLRAKLRAQGEPLDSLHLADGLLRYSERGQDYVDSLKGMIRSNGLNRADDATFRDEPIRFLVAGGDADNAAQVRAEIEKMREAGQLEEIYARMRLE
jgi:Bax protein